MKKHLFSCIISISLAISLIFFSAYPASATPYAFESTNIKSLSNTEILASIKYAKSTVEADLLFNEYLDRLDHLSIDAQEIQLRALANQYLRVNSVSYSNRVMTINYSILSIIPSGASLTLGYEFPAITRTSGSSIQLAQRAVGTYVQTFTVPNIICAVRASSMFTARNYSDSQVYATYNYTSSRYTDYHTVTTAEALGYWTVVTVVPGAIVKMFPASMLAKFAPYAVSVGGAVVSFFYATNVTLGPPSPASGQYVETVTWYENNRLYVNQRYWTSYAAYNNGDLPIYNSGTYIGANIPSF